MVSHRGIEANPTKVDSIGKMKRSTGKKDIMKLTSMMAALGRFISKLEEKGLPFFKLLKKSDKFEWTDETDQMLEELKTLLTTPPIMMPPAPKETLLLYISASTQVVSTVLVANDLKKVTLAPSNDLSTTSVRSYLTTRLGTRNPRRCCTLFSSLRASSNITFSSTRSMSSLASPWVKSCTAVTPWDASSSGRSSLANSSLSSVHDRPLSPKSLQTSSLSGQRPNNPTDGEAKALEDVLRWFHEP
jgi:dsDNA-binding SOS-regulon protein